MSRRRPPSPRHPLALVLAITLAIAAFPFAAVGDEAVGDEAVGDGGVLSPRNANYTLEASLDPATRILEGRGTLVWRNLQERATSELHFHLYWNAWRNSRSSWMLENRLSPRSSRRVNPGPDDWGWMEVEAMGFEGADLLAGARHAAPDDGNPDDRTVLVVPLPRAVTPGETVEVAFAWRSKVPHTFARTGARGDFFFIAHWFPKLGVFEAEGWSCHQFHSPTEFYSDFGVYDVTLELPAEYVVGATGRRQERRELPGGRARHRFVHEDVHGFAWTASPDFEVLRSRFESPGLPPVELELLLQPEHRHQAERHFDATRVALEHYGRWYGPYPYGHLTIVDPAFESGAGGMEYPTLITAGTRLFNPPGGGSPEGVTIHEAGHQFWYGVVANDESEHAWLDEGLVTFSTARAYDAAYGDRTVVERYFKPPGTRFRGFLPVRFHGFRLVRAVHGNRLDRFLAAGADTADAPEVPTFRYYPPTAPHLSYSKTSLWLATLERHLGWPTLRRILATFYERHSFRHPEPDDFFTVASEMAGEDLSWFFDQVHRDSVAFDYAVASVASLPAEPRGWVEEEGELVLAEPPGEPALYRTEVVVRRHGGGVFPVEVLLRFEDGEEVRIPWDGAERWKLFAVERAARLERAVVDPERVLLLDVDYTNNSRLREPAPGLAVFKWSSRWMAWLQELLHTFTFFV